MRIAFVGKGGAGKSAIAGTLARLLARQGKAVLAVDSDPLPGLAYSLGLPIDDTPPIPEDAVVERKEGEKGPRYRLRPDLEPAEAVELYSVAAPDGVRFLQFGKIRGQGNNHLFRAQLAFRQIVLQLPEGHWDVVGDLPGGTRQPFTGWGSFARTALIVVEPTAHGMLSARRLANMVHLESGPSRVFAIANKVRRDDDADLVAEGTGLEVIGAIPWDEAFAEAERAEKAPLDEAPGSAAVEAIESLLARVVAEAAADDAADEAADEVKLEAAE